MKRMFTEKLSEAEFTLVEIMIVVAIVVAIVALLATMSIPSYARARNFSQSNTCVNNLRQINGGTDQWAIENKKLDTDTVTMTNIGIYLKSTPQCPADGICSVSTVASDPTCSVGGDHVLLSQPADNKVDGTRSAGWFSAMRFIPGICANCRIIFGG